MDNDFVLAVARDTGSDVSSSEVGREKDFEQEGFDKFWLELNEEQSVLHVDGNPISVATGEDDTSDREELELEFERRVERVRKTATGNPRFVEINYHILEFCQEQRILSDIEDMVATLPQFEHCSQNQYRLISFLENAGGLDRIELDEEFNPVTEQMKEGLGEDEIDDLVCDYSFITTDAGKVIAEELKPAKRIKDLMEFFPKRAQTYREVLDFCKEPRSWQEIDKLFEGRDVLKSGSLNTMTDIPLKPSAFIDRLERSGGLIWDKCWKITPEGRRYLEAF
jgi:hypothetical protein